MATYSQLLIGAGGGILNRHQQSEQQEGATVAIGIGGTGASALARLKREVFRKIRPDNPDAAIPAYKNIKFLLIDADKTKLEGRSDLTDIDLRTEYFDISNKAIRKSFASKDLLRNRPELSWLNYEQITVKEAGTEGAGGIRQVGRFMLFEKATSLRARLKSVINDALTGVQGGNIGIHIFSGLSGGTGGGCFIDTCYILRCALEELGRDNVRICGYFFLPDVNLSIPSIAVSPRISGFIQVNGYAALKELDYLMDLGINGDAFEQNYGTFSVRSELPPVDLCYLVSSTQTDGTLVENGYDYAMCVATDYVLAFITKVELPDGCEAGDNDGGQTLLGHIANLEQAKAGIRKKHGASVDYNIIGASDATMPLADIATYLGSKLFDIFSYMFDRVPSPAELNNFVTKTGLTYGEIINKLGKGIVWHVNIPDFDLRKLKQGNGFIVNRADNWLADTTGILERNLRELSEQIADYRIAQTPVSLIGNTFAQLHNTYALDYNNGPFFAMRLLAGRENRNLLHIIDGHIEQAETALSIELKQNESLETQLERAWEGVGRANFLNFTKKCNEYLKCVNRQYVHLGKLRQYQTMLELLRDFRKQIIQLNNDFFSVLTTVLDTLQNTFRENANILTNGVRTENLYTWSVLSVPDIKDSLDYSVSKMDVGQVTKEFLDNMFSEYKSWMNQDPNKIRKLVSDFVIKKFDDITQQTFLDYLKIKYQTNDSVKLKDCIKNEIIQNKLADRSEPLFWSNSIFSIDEVARNCVLSVPFNVPEIVQAAEEFSQGDSQFTIRRTGLTDRMFMMRFYSGVPLYAYQGLQQLEMAYENDSKPGCHLYEAGDKDWNKFLPSPIPASFKVSGYKNIRIEQQNERLKQEFDEACERGIICNEQGQWIIKESTNSSTLEAIAQCISQVQVNNSEDVKKLKELSQRLILLRDEGKKAENQRNYVIGIRGAHSQYLDNVLMDNYFRYPVLNQKVSRELQRQRLVEDALKKTNELLAGVGADERLKEHYFNALFTGCIQMLPSKIVFTYEEYGISTTIDLQNAGMTYSKCGVYQAFLTYLSLEPEMRERIEQETEYRLDSMDESIYNCAVNIYQKYNKDLLKLILSSVENDPKYGEIEFFYKEFIRALQTYLQMYK